MKKSLGVLLAIGLAGLQFVAVVLVVSSSYVTSEQALLRHARDLLRDVGINTIEHSKSFLNPAEGAAELAARLAQNRIIASDDTRLLEQLLFQQLQIAPQFAGVYYGSEDGTFVYVMRDPGGPGPFRSKIITPRADGRQVELIWRDNNFGILAARDDPTDIYDPRTRPWYQKARADLTTIWTDPYIFFSSRQPGITLAAPVMGQQGAIRGVVGVDIEISMISNFLARLNIGETGKALIIHRNGDVIAHPNPELIKITRDDGTLRFANIREFDDPLARTAFAPLARDGTIQVTEETPSQFVYDGQSYVSTLMPLISERLPWTIAVYAPENDFTGVIKANRTANIWIAALVAAITGVIGLYLAKYIYAPVRAFAVRSSLVAQGEIDAADPMPKTYRELERANDTLVREIVSRRATEREYGQTFEMASRGMAQLAPGSGQFIRVNARLCGITGYSAEELGRMRFPDLADPDEAAPDRAAMQILDDDRPENLALNQELRITRKDGQAIWVTVNAIMIRNRDGRLLHVVLTMEDITEARNREGQILRLNRDLSHLARGNTMGQMASGLAHELNQPLTAIAQNSDAAILLLNRAPLARDELNEILHEIERQSLRAGEIIRALRSFIRKDEGTRIAFDFAELLDQSLRLVHAEAVESGVTIETELEPDLPRVEGNRIQVAQVIVNLLHNAIEAMTTNGKNERRITIAARRVTGTPADQVLVSVQDTGPGVDPSITLFSQFETSKPAGMGLGLSICRTMIEANGGALWHEGGAGGGARFNFTLPLPRGMTGATGGQARRMT